MNASQTSNPFPTMTEPSSSSAKKTEPSRNFPWKWIVAGLGLVGLIGLFRIFPIADYLEQFNNWVRDLGPLGFVLFIAVYIVSAVFFVPGSVLTLGAGFAFGLGWGTVAVSVAATSAAAISFLIARYLLRERFEKKIQDNRKFSAIDRAIGKEGGKIVFLLRLTPVMPFSLGNYLFGLTAVRFAPYVLASWIGMIPGTLLYVYIGSLGQAGLQAAGGAADTGKLVVQVLALLAIVAVTFVITRIARKALKEAELEQPKETEG